MSQTSTHPRQARRTAAGLAGLALGLTGLGLTELAQPAPALADTSTPSGCVSAGKVWLQVTTDTHRTLASQCVGTPSSGTAALQAAGLGLVRDSSGLLCTIGGYPSNCLPWTQRKQYWNYYHLTPGGSWEYSNQGADQYQPKAGTVEAWCYNAPGTKSCTPPMVDARIVKATASPTPRTTSSHTATTRPSASASAARTPLDDVTPAPSSALASSRATSTAGAPSTIATAATASTIPTRSASSVPPSTPAAVTPSATPSGTPSATPSATASTVTPEPTATATDTASMAPVTTSSSSSSGGSGPWGVIGTLALLGAGGLGYWLWHRRRPTTPGA